MGGDLPYRWSPLFPAAMAANVPMTRRLLEMGIDPHLRGTDGNALSIAACITPRSVRPAREARARINEVVGLLLAAGVAPNYAYDGRTPLRCAEDNQNHELVATLGAAGGRSRESAWNKLKRGASVAGFSLLLILGGGM